MTLVSSDLGWKGRGGGGSAKGGFAQRGDSLKKKTYHMISRKRQREVGGTLLKTSMVTQSQYKEVRGFSSQLV